MRHSAIGMCLVGTDGSFLEVNEALCVMFGRDEAALRACTWQELTHPDDLVADAALVQQIVDGTKDAYRLTKRYLRPDGIVVHGDLSVVGMRGADRRIQYFISQVVDITDQVRAAEALAASERQARDLMELYEQARDDALEANAAKTAFLSRMSHELRTPLNAILGFDQLLELEDLTVDQREFVEQIRSGGRHLLALVSEVLDVSRIESGTLRIALETVAVADVVDEAVDLVLNQAAAAGVTVGRTVCPNGATHVLANRRRMVQVLVNLVSNGIKYNREGGSVQLDCEPRGKDDLAIRVTDTGRGVHPDQFERLFEPFDRLGAELSTIEGTGIGLALSRGLAHAMAGRVEVESVLGEGSTFTLVLPRSEPVDRGPAEVPAVPRPVAGAELDVLYIEDNLANQALMTSIARLRPNVRLRLAPTGTSGVQAAKEHTPDLVLLDLHLPDIQGDEVIDQLHADPATAHVPVVVLTADATAGLDERLNHAGADGLITKPVDVDFVLAWLDRAATPGP